MPAALVELGHPDATVRRLADGYLGIRTEPIDLLAAGDSAAKRLARRLGLARSGAVRRRLTPARRARRSRASRRRHRRHRRAAVGREASASPSAEPAPIAATKGTGSRTSRARSLPSSDRGEPRSLTTVGPLIGSELIRSSVILISIGELFILAYLWIRFGFRFGTAAIVALLHDVIMVIGAFAILGYFFALEFDALFVTALLTIIGFSVHDTIVVFDRIRENRIRHAGEPFGAIVNHSILQTLGRSIITVLTVVVTLSALLLLGPLTIRTFALALLIGVVSGTYSSIFNASQILVAWDEWEPPPEGAQGRRPPSPRRGLLGRDPVTER